MFPLKSNIFLKGGNETFSLQGGKPRGLLSPLLFDIVLGKFVKTEKRKILKINYW